MNIVSVVDGGLAEFALVLAHGSDLGGVAGHEGVAVEVEEVVDAAGGTSCGLLVHVRRFGGCGFGQGGVALGPQLGCQGGFGFSGGGRRGVGVGDALLGPGRLVRSACAGLLGRSGPPVGAVRSLGSSTRPRLGRA